MVRGILNSSTSTPSYRSGRIDRAVRPSDRPKIDKADLKKDLARMRARDAELVVGVFKNMENAGASLRFGYHRYPDDPFETYELMDGETYQLPRGVARHLNNNCFYKEYRHLQGEQGQVGVRAAYNDGSVNAERMHESRKVHRFAFHSLDYMEDDLDMMPSKSLYAVSRPDSPLDVK